MSRAHQLQVAKLRQLAEQEAVEATSSDAAAFGVASLLCLV
jgi:hypothetical protein